MKALCELKGKEALNRRKRRQQRPTALVRRASEPVEFGRPYRSAAASESRRTCGVGEQWYHKVPLDGLGGPSYRETPWYGL